MRLWIVMTWHEDGVPPTLAFLFDVDEAYGYAIEVLIRLHHRVKLFRYDGQGVPPVLLVEQTGAIA